MNETTWDAGTTTWDRDWDGPGTRTKWDLLPEFIGRGARVVWQGAIKLARWAEPLKRIRW